MSSRDGAQRAQIDTGLFHDTKVGNLARRQRDGTRTAVSVALFVATILASWREDRPVALVDATPLWFMDDPTPYVEDLIAVDLLDADGCIERATLDDWIGPYRKAVAGGHVGAARRWGGHKVPNGEANAIDREIDREIERVKGETPRGGSPRRFSDFMAEHGGFAASLAKETKP